MYVGKLFYVKELEAWLVTSAVYEVPFRMHFNAATRSLSAVCFLGSGSTLRTVLVGLSEVTLLPYWPALGIPAFTMISDGRN